MNENERSALAAYRTSLGAKRPDPGRDWSRLLSKIEAGTQPLSVELEPPPRRRGIAWGLSAAAAVTLAMWVWPRFEAVQVQGEDTAGASQAAYGAEERASSVLARPQPEPVRHMEATPPPSISGAPVTPEEVAPEPVLRETSKHVAYPADRSKQPAPSSPDTKPAAAVSKTHDVVAEAKALRAIRASLRDQHGEHALRLLRRYLSRFPTGMLRDEATLLRADALCMDGQREKARGVASGFVRTHPNSPLTARARGVCREP